MIYQKDGDRRFYLEMPDKTIELRFCELLEFRGKIQAIDLTSHFDSSQNGIEIIKKIYACIICNDINWGNELRCNS